MYRKENSASYMSKYALKVNGLTKVFGRRLIFRGIDMETAHPGIIGVSGANGSGKSTFVKIIAGLLAPTAGKAEHIIDGKPVEESALPDILGLASPYLVLYDEFTAEENIRIFSELRGGGVNEVRMKELFAYFGLEERKDDLLKTYSSGMKQRVKFIFALQHQPKLLILDEPVSNLDIAGKNQIYDMIKKYGENNLVMIASNEESDLELCSETIFLGDYKKEAEGK